MVLLRLPVDSNVEILRLIINIYKNKMSFTTNHFGFSELSQSVCYEPIKQKGYKRLDGLIVRADRLKYQICFFLSAATAGRAAILTSLS